MGILMEWFFQNVGLVLAVVALGVSVWINFKQFRLHSFTIYTQRYHDIAINFPIDIESESFTFEKLDKETQESLLKWIRAFYNLCSEEHYLFTTNQAPKRAWKLWEDGMKSSFPKPAFKESWKTLSKHGYFDKQFVCFVEKIQDNDCPSS